MDKATGPSAVLTAIPAAVYVRVSTKGQADEHKYGLEAQESACRRYAERAGLRVAGVYSDVISGTKESREDLERLVREAPKYRAVVVYAVDRLARTVPLSYRLLEELQQAGLDVHSACEGPQSLGDDSGALRFGILAVFADHERRRITSRMYTGQLEKARQGKTVRPLNLYGYRDGQVFEEQATWVRWMFERTLDTGARAIATELTGLGVLTPTGGSVWAEGTVARMLACPVYKGEWGFGRKGERVVVPCPALVTDEVWESAQAARLQRVTHHGRKGSRQGTYGLQGRIRCAHCGHAMSGWHSSNGRGGPYYLCQHRHQGCEHRRHHRTEAVHAAVLAGLRALLDDESALLEAIALPVAPARDLSADVTRLEGQLRRAREGYLADAFTLEEFKQARASIEVKIKALETEAVAPGIKPADLAHARARLERALSDDNFLAVVNASRPTITLSMNGDIHLEIEP